MALGLGCGRGVCARAFVWTGAGLQETRNGACSYLGCGLVSEFATPRLGNDFAFAPLGSVGATLADQL